MTDLSDFLGHILQEVTRARVFADQEAVRVAKRYAADPDGLLKHFAVPRVRLPNIEITAPLVVSSVPSGFTEKADPELLSQVMSKSIFDLLAGQKISFSITDIVGIIKSDPDLSKGYLLPSSADSLSLAIGNQIKLPIRKQPRSGVTHAQIVALIREKIAQTLQILPRSTVGISVDATTSAVREFSRTAGQGVNVLYVKMSITEEALDIEFEPRDGAQPSDQTAAIPTIKRLSPE